MRVTVDQPIAAPLGGVEEALVDPRFYKALGSMPAIGAPEVLECSVDGGDVFLRVRYAFTGDLAPAARRVLDPAKLTWVVESTIDRATHTTAFRMLPDHYADRLSCRGSYALVANGDRATIQRMDADLRVNYPIVGRLAERGIARGLQENVAQQARIIERWVAGEGP
ncbi:MAG: DUF2505 family protein [Acidimicrobiia bacterium]|nr:DUF2505 family protein [Acidimicrobiia bacterium]